MQSHWIEESHAVALAVVLEAGALLIRLSGGPLDARLKHGHELVTRADVECEHLIERTIRTRFPRHRVVSEESWTGWSDEMLEGPTWIVDPIDGTVNFAHGHLHCAISVAFAVDGEVLSGAVRAPFLAQTFDAERGRGARLNGVPISVGSPASLAEAVVGTGFPHERSDLEEPMKRVDALLRSCRDIRRSGCPTLDICWVGAGMLDAHAEDLAPWDVAAAGLVATEAGARRGTLRPQRIPVSLDLASTGFIVAAPTIFDELVALLTRR
jgi:myo-inositol-1(or 4)-monophosphatase